MPDLISAAASDPGRPAGSVSACAGPPLLAHVAAHIARDSSFLSAAAPRIGTTTSARPIGAGLEASLPDGEGSPFPARLDPRPNATSSPAVELTTSQRNRPTRRPGANCIWFRRPDVEKPFRELPHSLTASTRTGFVAFVRDPCNAGFSLQPTLSLRLHSGARMEIRPPLRQPTAVAARTAVLSSVPLEDVTDTILGDCLGPAAASFHKQSLEDRGAPEMIRIGKPPANPSVSIIIPLYRNLSFLRFQIASFAHDPECHTAEFIFVLDSPEQRREVEHLVRGLYAMHGLPVTLVIMSNNLGYAAANNTGATYARAPTLLLLNSDVVPSRPLWLGNLTAALALPGIGAVGPKLLFDDESIQHAGLFFQRDLDGVWLNAHYHKGMPRAWPGAAQPRRVPGVTGAALMVHRHLFEALGGVCEDYIVGDYEDSDFCLRLHAAGAQTMYVPASELSSILSVVQ